MEDNGGLNANTAATLALLADTSRAGRGGMYGGGYGEGGGYSGYGQYANHSSIQHGLANVSQNVEDQNDCTRLVLGAGMQGISGAFENAERSRQFNELKDGQFRLELRNSDKVDALAAVVNQNAKDAAACCCELKLENCKNTSKLEADILAVESRTIARELDTANRIILEMKLEKRHGGH
ncbi:MAG: hypothetical protein V3W20_10665 [Candidatus Neomarinimicrobiota bacterium]